MRWLILGDSISKGDSVIPYGTLCEREAYVARGLDAVPLSVVNNGYNGLSTTTLLSFWDTLVTSVNAPEIISVMIGVNDHYAPDLVTPNTSLAQFKTNVGTIIDQLKAITTSSAFNDGKPLLLMCAPPFCMNIDGSNAMRLYTYACAMMSVAKAKGVAFFNTFLATAEACGPSWSQDMFASTYAIDTGGVHYNSAGHALIWRHLKPRLTGLIYGDT